ncbi:MAG: hypothetical protein HQ504_11220 [Rhodospirillaceae bacterium]|nr:hypothetical protein [Rhodospirillaceae bacterium]
MFKKPPLIGMLVAGALAISAGACVGGSKSMVSEGDPGAIKAVDLLATWVGAGAPNGAFSYEDMSGNATDANFDTDILPLFTKDEIWGEGTAACTSCHFDNSEDSYHEMDLSSYEGMMKGADVNEQPPGVPLFGQSMGVGMTDFDWGHSKMKARLRNNRMPPGVEFDITEENRDGPTGKEVGMIEAWVASGAKNDATFQNMILPMFTTDEVWGEGTAACTSCHFDNSEDSYHEMDLSTYEGVMKGADVNEQPPGVPLFGQSMGMGMTDFDWGHGKMKERLRNNRMPPGIEFDITEENRDGPIVAHGM